MSSTTTKIVAIVAVLALAGAAGAAFVLLNDKGDDGNAKIQTALAVYGNANNDDDINQDDIDLIQKIIDEDLDWSKDYPLADANCDGKVNQTDIDFVMSIKDRTCKNVNISCLDIDGKTIHVSVDYPLKNIVPVGTNMLPVVINSGAYKTAVGAYFNLTYGVAEKALKDNAKIIDLGNTSSRSIDEAAWINFTNYDTSNPVGAMFVDHSLASAITDKYRSDLNAAGIPEIRLAVADAFEDISATMLVGFLVGGEAESTARNYAQASWNVYEDIKDKLKNMPEDKKETFIGINMSYYVCQNGSTFGKAASYVSGIPYSDVNSEFKKAYEGDGSSAMKSPDALSKYAISTQLNGNRGIENIFSMRSIDYQGSDLKKTIVSEWEKKAGKTTYTTDQFFKDLDCYENNFFYINNLLPGACKLAYFAACMYPEYYSMEDANNVVTQFATFCDTLDGVTVENSLLCFDYSDYKEAKGI